MAMWSFALSTRNAATSSLVPPEAPLLGSYVALWQNGLALCAPPPPPPVFVSGFLWFSLQAALRTVQLSDLLLDPPDVPL